MGQPTSGQSKEMLAATLGLNGEIAAILETSNAIIVKINEQEAQKWRGDGRVISVEPSMEGTWPATQNNPGDQDDYPVYRDNTLTIPRVDTDQQAGIFQGGVFQYDSSTNAWQLQSHRVAPVIDIFLIESDGVELIVRETFPTQVFLKVKGNFSNGCHMLGRIDPSFEG